MLVYYKPLCNTRVKRKFGIMNKYFTISQTAQIVNMTAETLRHYDRIGLIKPSKIDEWTNYRYYSEQDIVYLKTIHALRCMGISLSEIKEILDCEDLSKIVSYLRQAEKKADIKIAEINYAKSKIHASRIYHESKLESNEPKGMFVKSIPQRVILLSDRISTPSLDNLWDYHRHFFEQVGDDKKDDFSFEDLAGIYESNGKSQLFAICTRHTNVAGLEVLAEGEYLCADCTQNNRNEVLEQLLRTAQDKYSIMPESTIQIVVLSGILKWNYQLQIFIGKSI